MKLLRLNLNRWSKMNLKWPNLSSRNNVRLPLNRKTSLKSKEFKKLFKERFLWPSMNLR